MSKADVPIKGAWLSKRHCSFSGVNSSSSTSMNVNTMIIKSSLCETAVPAWRQLLHRACSGCLLSHLLLLLALSTVCLLKLPHRPALPWQFKAFGTHLSVSNCQHGGQSKSANLSKANRAKWWAFQCFNVYVSIFYFNSASMLQQTNESEKLGNPWMSQLHLFISAAWLIVFHPSTSWP